MKFLPADKRRNQMQFDSFAKKILRGEASHYLREIAIRSKHEINFSDLSDAEFDRLLTVDEYATDATHYNIQGLDIAVRNDLLAEALDALPEHRRNVILLAFFMEMSYIEIAAFLNNNRKTIYRHRVNALDQLKILMKEDNEIDENKDFQNP